MINIKSYAKAVTPNQKHTSFLKRRIKLLITLQEGSFKGGEGNSFSITDLAMSVKVEKAGPPDFGKANVTIYGLPLDVMEQLSTLGMKPLYVKKNILHVYAGDDVNGLNQLYAGTITKASADFNGAPEIKFNIECTTGFFGSITAQGDSVVNGNQSAASFIERQVKLAGFSFKNEGVTDQIKNSVFQGSPIEQARQCAREVGAELMLDDDKAILLKSGASRKGNTVVLNKNTGLLGYPTLTQDGIDLKCIFDSNLQFGGLIKVESIVPKASGVWRISKLSHELDCNLPSTGKWESKISATSVDVEGSVGKFQG